MSKKRETLRVEYQDPPRSIDDLEDIIAEVDTLLSLAGDLLSLTVKYRSKGLDNWESRQIKKAYDNLNRLVIDSIHQAQLSLDHYGEDNAPTDDELEDMYRSMNESVETSDTRDIPSYDSILGIMSALSTPKGHGFFTEEINDDREYVNPPKVNGYKLNDVRTQKNSKGKISVFEYTYNKDPELKVDFGVTVPVDGDDTNLDIVVYVDNKIVCSMGGTSPSSEADSAIQEIMNGLRDDFDDLYKANQSIEKLSNSVGSAAMKLFKKNTESAREFR